MIEKLGTDGLRLWAASIDNAGDAVVSEVVIKNVQEVLRKIRNTCRFLLSNINDFDSAHDAIFIDTMKIVDKYALQELFELQETILQAYQDYNFTKVFHALGTYCSVNLSSFYLDIIKDRLYVEKHNGFERRSAQTVCATMLDTITKLMAPIVSFTAEQLSDHYQKNKTQSIHLQQFPMLQNVWSQISDQDHTRTTMFQYANAADCATHSIEKMEMLHNNEKKWDILKDIRSALLKAIEVQREKQIVKHSLEAQVFFYIDPSAHYASLVQNFFAQVNDNKETVESFFKEFLIVSQVTIIQDPDELHETVLKGLMARVDHADGVKCPRCWQWSMTQDPDNLCDRCKNIVG
jgi:isoleucyl-tRNA synthetase